MDEHGGARLQAAAREALSRETPEPQSVRLILERGRLEAGLPARTAVALPEDPRVREVAVRPATLAQYQSLRGDGDEEVRDEEA